MSDQTVGFVGVGRMGGPMVNRLLDAGHAVCVFDTSQEALAPLAARGATVAASAHDVASRAAVVLMSLPTPQVVQAVSLGESGIVAGSAVKTLIDLSTKIGSTSGRDRVTVSLGGAQAKTKYSTDKAHT